MAWYGRDFGSRWDRGRAEDPFSDRLLGGPRYDRAWRERGRGDPRRFHGGRHGHDWDDRLREGWNGLKREVRDVFGAGYDRGYSRRGSFSGGYDRSFGRGWW